ncbi:MAG: hypothetical protein SFW67_20235 [Myxococcaceae bacterium]|nr:hypothetical protein [Myxococcaceae bacterium]
MNVQGQKQCLLAGTASAPCPRGTFSGRFSDGIQLCLDLCTSVRDCAAGFFCNPTVLGDERGTSQSVKVCMPGAVNHAGMSCDNQTECEFASTELTCAGGSNSQTKICTRSCNSTADCGPARESFDVVCARTTTGSGVCVRACTPGASSFCGPGLTCSPGGHCLPTPNAGTGGTTTFPTPGFGALGGACGNSNDCEGRYACLTSRPGGLCTATCQSSAECGSGECVDQQGTGVCFAKCSSPGTQSNCRAGYQCRALQGRSYGICG